MNEKRFTLSSGMAAQLTGRHPNNFFFWAKRGEIEAQKKLVNKRFRWLFNPDEVRQIVKERPLQSFLRSESFQK